MSTSLPMNWTPLGGVPVLEVTRIETLPESGVVTAACTGNAGVAPVPSGSVVTVLPAWTV